MGSYFTDHQTYTIQICKYLHNRRPKLKSLDDVRVWHQNSKFSRFLLTGREVSLDLNNWKVEERSDVKGWKLTKIAIKIH